MRFKNYIIENKLLDIISIEQMAKLFSKDCKPFFKDFYNIWDGEFFLSGRKNATSIFDKKRVRTDRRPLDTPEDIHNLINHWFYKKFGIKARGSSIFCTFSHTISTDYGISYYIIPIGKYAAIASPNIKDFYGNIIDDGTGNLDMNSEDDKEYIINSLEKGNYKINKRFKDNQTEYMVSCKEYYMIESYYMTEDIIEQVLTEMGISP